ncbi:MAG: flippase-like domain-containing protein [Bacteroidetes bacterium]|nr:flippase-like domain-containing protein [Bacteroidota bacterium]
MKKKLISVFQYLIFLIIGIGLLWLVFQKQDLNKIIIEFQNANYFWIFLSILVGILSHVSRAIRWNLLISSIGYKTKTTTTFYAVMIGYFANMAIPRIGEITRCGIVSKSNKIPLNAVIGTVIAERIFDMLCLLILIIATIAFQFAFLKDFLNKMLIEPLLSKFSFNTISIIILCIGIIILGLAFYFGYKLLIKILKKRRFFYKLKRLVVGFIIGIKSIKKIKRKELFIFHTVFIWAMYVLMLYLCFFAIKSTSNLTFVDAITITVIGSLGIVAPVPGGIGTYHFLVTITLVELFNIAKESAASLAIIVHESQAVMMIVLGVISLILIFFLNKKNKENEEI